MGNSNTAQIRSGQEAVTYKDLFLGVQGLAYFRTIDIREKPGEHAFLFAEAVMDSEMDDNDLH